MLFLGHQTPHNHTDLGLRNKQLKANLEYYFVQFRKGLRHGDRMWFCRQVTRLRAFDYRARRSTNLEIANCIHFRQIYYDSA